MTKGGFDQFLSEVRKARRELGSPEIVWYRGHTDPSFKLVPTLLRYGNGLKQEETLFHRYVRASAMLLDKRALDWETLYDMQHYYVPTRLLDWTEVLGVAIFFALLSPSGDSSIFILDPVGLNKRATGHSKLKEADDPSFLYKSVYWEGRPFKPQLPIAIVPRFQNDRLRAQKGVFTVHNDSTAGVEEQVPECVRQVVLPETARTGAREFLEYANINEFSVFPDMVGLAPFIKHLAKLEK